MADILIDDVVKELDTYLAHNPDLISTKINAANSVLDLHTKPITKIKGQFPQGSTLMSNVVQGFDDSGFNDMGQLQIKHKILRNYHQKVNFGFIPSQILSSYWGHLYQENIAKEDMPFSKYVIENELLAQVMDDLATLEIKGEYDPARLGEFGFSMRGIETIIADLFAGVPGTDHTPFKIPLTALTDNNIIDQVTLFERSIPTKVKSRVKKIFMSESNVERYRLAYEDRFGDNKFQDNSTSTRLSKLPIIALPYMEGDEIFATVENNFVRLVDLFDGKPAVTDIQKEDYKVKLFMEFWKGYDFLINELVFVSNYADAELGLGSQTLNQTYYGFDGVTVP